MSIYKPQVKRFCKEFEKIENYQEAVSSPEKYDCHHRLEETGLSKKDLIDMNMYYNRPANELIFLTSSAHRSLHSKGNKYSLGKNHAGQNNGMYGKHHSEEAKKKISKANKGKIHSEEAKQKMSKNHADFSGSKNPAYKFICPIKLAYMYNKQNMTIDEIARELNVGRSLIWRRLQELKR